VFGFGVQDVMVDLFGAQDAGEGFGVVDGGGADEDGMAVAADGLYFVGDGVPFFACGAVDAVGGADSPEGAMGGDGEDMQLVDFAELGALGGGGAGHAGEFFIQREEVLVGGAGEGLCGRVDGHVFFGLDGLVESFGPGAAGHAASGELVDD